MRVLKVRRVPLPYALFHSYNTLLLNFFFRIFKRKVVVEKKDRLLPSSQSTTLHNEMQMHTYIHMYVSFSLALTAAIYFSIRFFLFFFYKNRFQVMEQNYRVFTD